jgi:hypothetical protein
MRTASFQELEGVDGSSSILVDAGHDVRNPDVVVRVEDQFFKCFGERPPLLILQILRSEDVFPRRKGLTDSANLMRREWPTGGWRIGDGVAASYGRTDVSSLERG